LNTPRSILSRGSSSSHFKLARELLKRQLRPILKPRRFQAYCLGTAKSGTPSIAEIFNPNYRALHEPESEELIAKVLAAQNSQQSKSALLEYVKRRDRNMRLELDSSQLNYFLLDSLVSEFPNAKFILTIRDCYSWLDSFINHQLSRNCSPNWQRLRDFRFDSNSEYKEEERILAQHGLYTLDGYLSYWAEHNREVLTTVPKEKLLVVRTHEIPQEIEKIADFLSISLDKLNLSKAHSFKAKNHFNILSEIDKQFIDNKVNLHCKSLMDEFFPEFMQCRE
jgi:protoheme ferro-lyase